MSFIPSRQVNELCKLAAYADKEARSDLARGFIVGENDYTSNFTGALRRIINSNSRSGLSATSYLLTPTAERRLGADAAIILTYGHQSKVAVFEGKWPRFSRPGHQWDSIQKSTGDSHFSDQLQRQHRLNDRFAVFEMVYCEYDFGKEPSFLKSEGSTCIWHNDAESYRVLHKHDGKLWSQDDLKDLLQSSGTSLSHVIRDFGLCRRGDVLPLTDPIAIGLEFRLPANILVIDAEANEVIRRF